MTDARWASEPDFTEVARKLVFRINEIQPDQWDECDDKDQARIVVALKASYQQGRVAGLRECKHGLDIALDEGPLKAALYRWIDARAERLEREAQQAQDEKGVGDGHSQAKVQALPGRGNGQHHAV